MPQGSVGIKASGRMLIKMTPGVDFTNFYKKLFKWKDPISAKRHRWLDCLFALLGSVSAKATHKHIGEINTWLQLKKTVKIKWKRCFKLREKYSCKVVIAKA